MTIGTTNLSKAMRREEIPPEVLGYAVDMPESDLERIHPFTGWVPVIEIQEDHIGRSGTAYRRGDIVPVSNPEGVIVAYTLYSMAFWVGIQAGTLRQIRLATLSWEQELGRPIRIDRDIYNLAQFPADEKGQPNMAFWAAWKDAERRFRSLRGTKRARHDDFLRWALKNPVLGSWPR